MSDLSDLIALLRTFGPLFVAVCFFLYRDYRREDRLATRIDQLESETRSILLPLVKETTAVIAHNTLAFERLERRLPL